MKRRFLPMALVFLLAATVWGQTTPSDPAVQGEPARKQAKRHHAHPAEKHAAHPAERHKAHPATRHTAHAAPHHPKPNTKSHKKSKPDANGVPPV